MCLANCHAHTNVTSHVHKVHMQMVVAWLVVAEYPQVPSHYGILLKQGLQHIFSCHCLHHQPAAYSAYYITRILH